nr:recombinase zinc beta ribbon domain-containing protein [Thiocapsa sp.]
MIKDHLPAYIARDQYEHNLRQLAANTAQAGGVVRAGPSLLSGRLICGRCGLAMATQYTNSGSGLRYVCSREAVDYGAPLCQALAGAPLDALIGRLVLEALQPAALEISLQVAEDLQGERARRHEHWQQRLERARYEAARAERQYRAVEPENRLVARTLEQDWEAALAAQDQLEAEYARCMASEPTALSAEERTRIRQLAGDLPALWTAETTGNDERQAIVRLLVERVIVTVVDDSEQVAVEVHWIGGHHTRERLTRPVARLEQLSTYPELAARVLCLHQEGQTCAQIARQLNAEQWHPAKRRQTFNAAMVATLLARQGVAAGSSTRRQAPWVDRQADEWSLRELALELEMPSVTLFSWLRRGVLQARRVERGGQRQWLIRADAAEVERLRALRSVPRRWARHVRVGSDDPSVDPA